MAISSARREVSARHNHFLDQEQGGRMLPEQKLTSTRGSILSPLRDSAPAFIAPALLH
jgi:hypothetical protein